MKKYIYIAIGVIVLGLSIAVTVLSNQLSKRKDRIEALTETVNAYSNENSILNENNKEFKLTVSQLNYLNDSLVMSLNKARRELGIKDKEIQRLGYIASTAHKTDTIRFRDTLFVDTFTGIDTTIVDNNDWYRCNVGLTYPNIVSIEPTFKSEKCVFTYVKRETVNPPKKCWLGRLFQKKHNVVTIDVVENNPYITNEKERFITIVD